MSGRASVSVPKTLRSQSNEEVSRSVFAGTCPRRSGCPAAGRTSRPSRNSRQATDQGPQEYNAYVSAVQQSDPAAKAQAIEAFLQTYSSSVMKEDALVQLMGAYQQSNNASKTIDTASRILQANPNNVRALALLAYYYRSLCAQGGADAPKNCDQASQYGQKGLDALPNTPKPDGLSDADFTKFHNDLAGIFDGALGFAALQKKDLSTAQKDLREAVSLESQPSIADIYPLATADLEAKPMNPEGFWFAIKAAGLAQGPGQQQILDYARKKYIRYHGSEEGWSDILKQAQASTSVMPPAEFTVAAAPPPPSPAEQAADLVKSKDPKTMSFAEWQLVLSSGNAQASDTVFTALKDKAVKLVANVISASPTKLTLAGSADDIDDKKADITLTMAKPLPAKLVPAVGTLTQFQATVSSYTPSPFMLVMTDGVLLDKAGNPIGTAAAAPAHKAPAKKKQ